MLLESGDFLSARRLYVKALERDPTSPSAQYGLGMTYCAEAIYKAELGLGQPLDWYPAIYHVTIASNMDKSDDIRKTLAILHFNLGAGYRSSGDNSGAIARLEQALTYDSTLLKALNLLGAMYHEQGDLEKAESKYRRAVAVRPDYALAHFNRGAVAWVKGDFQTARDAFASAFSLDSTNSAFRLWYERAVKQVSSPRK